MKVTYVSLDVYIIRLNLQSIIIKKYVELGSKSASNQLGG